MPTRLNKLFVFAAVFFAVCALSAAPLLDVPKEFFIYNRSSKSWTFPAVKPNGRVVVEFRHRINYPRPAGWCPCWQIEVNGRVLTSMGNRTTPRLLNKPFRWYHKWHGYYRVDNCSDKWYSLYQPDYHTQDKLFVPENPEATRVMLDITDAVNVSGKNELKIRFGGVSESYYKLHKVFDRKPALAVKDLKVSQYSEPSPLKRATVKKTYVVMRELPLPRFNLVRENGQLLIRCGGVVVPVISRFTSPGGVWNEMGDKISLKTPEYQISRRIVTYPHRIDIFDTFKSNSKKLIGLKMEYGTRLGKFDPVYVAGDSSPSAAEFATGRNPSVYGSMPNKNFGIGFVAVDDVLRVQNISRCDKNMFKIGSDTFALSPGETRTVEWSVYPVASPDYFDFINTVRRDWKVNFPIIGSFNLSMNVYRRWNREQAIRSSRNMGLGLNTFGCHFWNHIGGKYAGYADNIWGIGREGKGVRVRLGNGSVIVKDPAPMNEFEKMCIARCRKYTPDVKILTYVHNQISVAADDAQYEDCSLVKSNGKKAYYGIKSRNIFIPTADNAVGKRFLRLIDWNFKNFDLDGIYWDEINHCNRRIYYGNKMWDKVSVELDSKFNIGRKISFVPLLKLQLTLKSMESILKKHGKLLIGNFSPETRSETQYHFPRFEETYSTRWIALSHLYTPIQLGDMLTYSNTPYEMAKDMRMALSRGALYYHYLGNTGCPSLTSKMFPFTPVELHSGWLLGKERILTALSGEFGWRGTNRLAETFVFNELGRLVPDYPAETFGTREGTRIRLDLKKDHCAALTAIPVEAELSGNVTLLGIHYAGGVMKCLAHGNGTVTLKSAKSARKIPVSGSKSIVFAVN